ncbi:hypothetical protein [Thioalkalivibrio thiocyanodenitrificans]|uniref:hypothetical protein n=1 Tax=Thioalkalivibrio thiocyanodenitrificans TaxID=243063 RepID=UPI000378F4BF|nr:hypothetical protein [Thioalkalivibrio thiocyanodenitrificans]
MRDIFRPLQDPARTIYDAFQAEAANRDGRSVEQWIAAEAKAVLDAATQAAQRLGLRAPTPEEVEHASILARGHVDYGAKWAYGVARTMEEGKERRPGQSTAAETR